MPEKPTFLTMLSIFLKLKLESEHPDFIFFCLEPILERWEIRE